jgi:hypothetical protein
MNFDLRKINIITATGNTFAEKTALRAAGFAWNADAKNWSCDLTDMAYNRRATLKNNIYPLTRKGVRFTGA